MLHHCRFLRHGVHTGSTALSLTTGLISIISSLCVIKFTHFNNHCYTPVTPGSFTLCSEKNVVERAETVWERSGRSSNFLRSVYELHGPAQSRWDGKGALGRRPCMLRYFRRLSRPAVRRSNNVMDVLHTELTYFDRFTEVLGRCATF